MDWKLNDLQRQAQAKRADLDKLNGYIVRLDGMLSEAQDFEGYYSEQIAAIDRRLFAVGEHYAVDAPVLVRRMTPANVIEHGQLTARRCALEAEQAAKRAERTTKGTDGVRTLTFCELRPDDVINKRRHVIIARDQVARDLAAIEEQLTPGELVTSGVPATEYSDHQARMAGLRERLGVPA